MIHQANYLLDQQIRQLEKAFVEEGGLRERIQEEAPKMKQLLTDAVRLELLRYDKLPGMFEVAADPGERGLFRDLHHWVNAKVNWVEAGLMNERAGRKSRAK